ncbi:hypothetical protein HYD_2100 [Candidatus Hydrogenosomobacter endosymbioticus]|uniref:Uncharacterized protein n=2 Tax=Candidatus Hydrogenosomobacter endosymbioticus TaxID=2558174 RepID=A0ABN6L7C0_9PROT|nr:hypothetical protein HYD_2100 [Candidatus Hydrogenosomobacter endosymbioticus]
MRSASHTQSRAKTSRQVKSSAARKRQKYPQSSGLFSGEVDADQPVEGGIRSAAGDKANKKMSIFAAKQRKPLEMRLKFYEKAYRKCANHVKSLQAQLAEDKENGPDCNCPESGDSRELQGEIGLLHGSVQQKDKDLAKLASSLKEKEGEVKEKEGKAKKMEDDINKLKSTVSKLTEKVAAYKAKYGKIEIPKQTQKPHHHANKKQNINNQQVNQNSPQSQAQNPEINQQIINQNMQAQQLTPEQAQQLQMQQTQMQQY